MTEPHQLAGRAAELAPLLESKAASSELLKIKAELEPPAPTDAELVRRFDESQAMYDRTSYPSTEARIAAYREREANETARLNEIRQSEEASRRAQVELEQARAEWADAEKAKLPWWRR